MENQNKTWIVIALGVIAVFGLVVFAVTYNGGGLGDRDERDNEDVYTSKDFDFSFERPKGYDLIEVPEADSGRHSIVLSRTEDRAVPENGEGPTAITIDVFTKPSTTDPDQWIRSNAVSNFGIAMDEPIELKVDGKDAIAYEWDGLYRGRSVVFESESRMILISGTYLEQTDQIYSDFDTIVSSFDQD